VLTFETKHWVCTIPRGDIRASRRTGDIAAWRRCAAASASFNRALLARCGDARDYALRTFLPACHSVLSALAPGALAAGALRVAPVRGRTCLRYCAPFIAHIEGYAALP